MGVDKCTRCGECCYIRINGKKVKCPYLLQVGEKTLCRIYINRLGKHIATVDGKKFYCAMREQVHANYEGCPYNKPEWKMVK